MSPGSAWEQGGGAIKQRRKVECTANELYINGKGIERGEGSQS